MYDPDLIARQDYDNYAKAEQDRKDLESKLQFLQSMRNHQQPYMSGTAGALGGLTDIVSALGQNKIHSQLQENTNTMAPLRGHAAYNAQAMQMLPQMIWAHALMGGHPEQHEQPQYAPLMPVGGYGY